MEKGEIKMAAAQLRHSVSTNQESQNGGHVQVQL